jgi:hypothetical protein
MVGAGNGAFLVMIGSTRNNGLRKRKIPFRPDATNRR